MRLLISFTALFLSVILVQMGSGAMGPLDALAGAAAGFSTAEIGLLGSAHFGGFFIGCWLAPRLMGGVGHSRAFAVFAASGAVGALAHPIWYDPWFWTALRVATGFAVAGAYTVIESWLQAKVRNAERGRVLGAYRVVDLGGSLAAQLLIAVLDPASYVSYNILAMLCCLCLIPLTLNTAKPPEAPRAPRLRPLRAFRVSPLAAAGVVVSGVTTPAFRMVGPVYGAEVGLSAAQIGVFLAMMIAGGALAQLPVGAVADRVDRRQVMIALSAFAAASCMTLAWAGRTDPATVYIGAFAFGMFVMPIFSISSAHANDLTEPDFVIELNASLLFIYAMGAILSPYAVALLIEVYGPSALFVFVAVAHIVLILFGLLRMMARAVAGPVTPYRYVPRTSFVMSRLMRRRPGEEDRG